MEVTKSDLKSYWDSKPCGSTEVDRPPAAPDYFHALANMRYRREPEVLAFADFAAWQGRRVLDIGCGMGVDFVSFQKQRADTIGIDLSFRSLIEARRNASVNQVEATLANADAEALPFPDETFDLVYSWGVLHHTPDTELALKEAHRVLRTGGECRMMLYHRRSLVAFQSYLRFGLAKGRPFDSISNLMADRIKWPGTKAYTVAEIRSLFRNFSFVEVQPVITAYDVRIGRRRFAPRWALRFFPNRLGWFLLVRARKQPSRPSVGPPSRQDSSPSKFL